MTFINPFPDAAFAILAIAIFYVFADGLNERRRARSLSNSMRRSALRAQARFTKTD